MRCNRGEPGTSALVILIDQAWLDNLAMHLSQFGGDMLHQSLSDAMVAGMVSGQKPS